MSLNSGYKHSHGADSLLRHVRAVCSGTNAMLSSRQLISLRPSDDFSLVPYVKLRLNRTMQLPPTDFVLPTCQQPRFFATNLALQI